MEAGKLRHRIVIQRVTETRDTDGGVVETWSTFATLWAEVSPLKGREFFDSAKVNAEVTHRIRIRHYPGITPKMRVSWDGRLFNIDAVLNIDERDREMHLMAIEVV